MLNGSVQLIRVPQYSDANVSALLTALPWNGSVGGVLTFECSGTLTLNADIDVSGIGFRGAVQYNQLCAYGNSNYFYAIGQSGGAPKGEGVAALPINGIYDCGKGANANGGGGGNGHNRGGGGGANGGNGGQGGSKVGDASFGEGLGGKGIDYLSY